MRSSLPWIALALGAVAASLLWWTRAAPANGDVDLAPDGARSASLADESELALAQVDDTARTAHAAESESARRAVRVVPERRPFPRAVTPGFEAPPPFASGAIEVRVVHDDSGAPFAGADVRLPVAPPSEWGSRPEPARTNERGVARFEGLREWTWDVVAEAPGCTPARSAASISARQPNAIVELRLASRREVLVRFVDAGGRDLELADLGLGPQDEAVLGLFLGARCGEIGSSFVQRDAPAHSARGVRTRDGSPAWNTAGARPDEASAPFRWNLEIRGDGPACIHAVLGWTIVAVEPLHPSASVALVRVERDAIRRAAAPVLVRVVEDAGEAPVPGAVVAVRPMGRDAFELVADDQGRVRVENVVAGVLEVTARAPGFVASKKDLHRPVEGEVVLRLRAGRSIAGVVLDRYERPVTDTFVGAFAAGSAGSSHASPAVDYVSTDGAGRFRFEQLPAGTYVVTATDDGRSQRVPKLSALPLESAFADCRHGDVAGLVLHAQLADTQSRSRAAPQPGLPR